MFGLFRKDDDIEVIGSSTRIKSENISTIEGTSIKLDGPTYVQSSLSVSGASRFSKPVGIIKSRNDDFGLSVTSILTDKLQIGDVGDNLSVHKGYLNTGENLFGSLSMTKTKYGSYPINSYNNGVYAKTYIEKLLIKDIVMTGDTINVDLGHASGEDNWWMYFNFQPSHWVHQDRTISGSLSMTVSLINHKSDGDKSVETKTISLASTSALNYGKGWENKNLLFLAKCNIPSSSDQFSFTGLTPGKYSLNFRLTFNATGSSNGAYHKLDYLGYFGIITENELRKSIYETYNNSSYAYPTSRLGQMIVTKTGSNYVWNGGAPSAFIAFCNNNLISSKPKLAVITYQGAKASTGSSIAVITPRGFIFGTDANNYVRLCLGQSENKSLGTEAENYSFKFKRSGQFVEKFDTR